MMTAVSLHKKIILITTALMLVIFAVVVNSAHAETAATTTKEQVLGCQLNKTLDELLLVKDSALTGIARDRAEFKARKAVLTQTIICAQEEIADTEGRLNNLKLVIEEDEILRIQFLNSLHVSLAQYNNFANSVASTTGLIDVKILAEEILEWRKNEYLPLLNKINDFILVVSSEESARIARGRLQKISTALSILRLANATSIKNLLDEAGTLTKKAERLNADARLLVSTYLVTVQATSTTSSTPISAASGTLELASGTPDTSKIKLEEPQLETKELVPEVTVVSLIKTSLESLKEAYTNYLKISALVKTILGL